MIGGIIPATEKENMMAYQKKNISAAELSFKRAEAGRRGAEALKKSGNHRGGRKPGMKLDTDPTTSCTIHKTDSDYIAAMSAALRISKAACIRVMILAYRRHCATFEAWPSTDEALLRTMKEYERFIAVK